MVAVSEPGVGAHIAGRYVVEERIGAGGMGVVLRARDERLARSVAIKILSSDAVGDETSRARLFREARAAAALDDPSIVHVYDVGATDDGGAFLVMELVRGRSLRDLLGAGGIAPAEAVRILGDVARALGSAHRAGFVHRDVKPDNVMIRDDGRVAILDFGLAKVTGPAAAGAAPLTTERGFVGTPAYMAPEQAEGGEVDGRADQFALGVMTYELLTGRLPWRGGSGLAIIAEVLQRDPPPPSRVVPSLGPALDAAVARALAKRPAARFPTVEAYAAALSRALGVSPPSVRPPPTPAAPIAAGTSGDVALAAPAPAEAPPAPAIAAPAGRSRRRAAVAVAVAALGAALGLRWVADRESPLPAGSPRRLTSAPGWEAEPALSPDGNLVAYASDEKGSADIWLVDARGGAPLRLTDDPAEDRSPAWFPDGSAIAFASNRGGAWGIWKVPRLGGSATPLVANAMDPAISPDGARIAFVRDSPAGEPLVWVAPIASTDRAAPITRGGDGFWQKRHPAWSPDGSRIAYHDFNDVWVVPAAGGEARALTTGSGGDGWPAWSRDGRSLYFSGLHDGTLALWRVPAAGGRLLRVTLGVGPEVQPSVSRDGARLAYSTYAEQPDLVVVDAGKGARATIPSSGAVHDVAIAPDGHEIAYVSDRQGGRGLWLQAMAGIEARGEPRRVTDLPGGIARPAYSPDGRWIAVHRVVDGQRDVWILPAAGGLPSQITDDPGADVQPAWSPDGSEIAFVSDRSGQRQVWAVPVREGRAAGAPRRVTEDAAQKSMPSWSPDGGSIAYLADDRGVSEVWVIASAGGAPPRRITTGAGAYCARWQKDAILVSGAWGRRRMTLARVSPETGRPAAFDPEVEFGNGDSALFDASSDGRVIVVDHETVRGDLWVLEAPAGSTY